MEKFTSIDQSLINDNETDDTTTLSHDTRMVSSTLYENPIKSVNTQTLARTLFDKELIRLQKRHDIISILRTHPLLTMADQALLRRLSGVMIRATTPIRINDMWKNTQYKSAKKGEDITIAQAAIFNMSSSELLELFDQTKTYLVNTDSQCLLEDIKSNSMNDFNDKYELRKKSKTGRDLKNLRENGVRIILKDEDIDKITRTYIETPHDFLTDKIKNKRIVSINGFSNSKTSLTIHDIFDHLWTFDLLTTNGTLERYNYFFDSIGNPQNTDIFKREGEIVASPVFEWRAAKNPDRNFTKIISLHVMRKLLLNSLDKLSQTNNEHIIRQKAANRQQAIEILDGISEENENQRIFESVFGGVMIELLEQRRKHGYIKELGINITTGEVEIKNILSLTNPDYMALIIEIINMLNTPEIKANETLFNLSALIENHLINTVNKKTKKELVIKLADIIQFDINNSNLTSKKIMWLRQNLGFATRKD